MELSQFVSSEKVCLRWLGLCFYCYLRMCCHKLPPDCLDCSEAFDIIYATRHSMDEGTNVFIRSRTAAASALTVAPRATMLVSRGMVKRLPISTTMLIRASEVPPRSKKSSLGPTSLTPRADFQISATDSSIPGSVAAGAGFRSGDGKALLSTLPFAVSGSAFRTTKTDGTMCPGRRR